MKLTKEEDEEKTIGERRSKKTIDSSKSTNKQRTFAAAGEKAKKNFSRCDVGKDGNNVLGGGEINK